MLLQELESVVYIKINRMDIHRIKPISQTTDYMEDLAKVNGTTVSTCGYITCAIIQFLSEQFENKIDLKEIISKINQKSMTPYIQKVMKNIAATRRIQIKKFANQMNDNQKKNYLRDWVASHQIQDYLASIMDKMINKQVFFFRQVCYDHPQALQSIKFEEAQRIKGDLPFKGQVYFYTSYFGQKKMNCHKEQFEEDLKIANKQLPILIATDVLGHFNVTILYESQIYVLDSLSNKQKYDQGIVQTIKYLYKKHYLK